MVSRQTPWEGEGTLSFMAGPASVKKRRALAMTTSPSSLLKRRRRRVMAQPQLLLESMLAFPPLQASLPRLQKRKVEAMATPTNLY